MLKSLFLAVCLAWLAIPAVAAEPLSLQGGLGELTAVPVTQLAALDRQALLAEDAEREMQPGVAPRFAVPHAVTITPQSNGQWETARDGRNVWRLRIHAAKARSINLAFSQYRLPEGAELHLFSEDGDYRIRPFTAADNKPHGELWTPVIQGDTLVLELQVPAAARNQVQLEIGSINYGYRGFFEPASARSGSCNVDVVCPEGNDWQYPISTVAVISTGGSTFCTGFMVNNVEYDGTPYFMTANHCSINAGNAASLVTYWNYENSTCRTPGSPESGGPGDGTLDQFNTGSTFRAALADSDFTLVELDSQPAPAWEVGYAGWDARDQATGSAVAIHHPSTDEKRISFENDPTSITDYLSATPDPNQTHIRVEDWDVGTTEPGSSGSPLFSPEGRVIGQLHGGYAACGNDDADWYGRIAYSWDTGGSASARLKDWLDPNDTGTLVVDGLGEEGFELQPATEALSQCGFADIDLAIDVAQFGEFTNPVTLSTTGTPTGVTTAFSVNPVTPPGNTLLTLSDLSLAGTGSFQFSVDGSDGGDFSDTVQISVSLNDAAPGVAGITSPADGAIGVSTTPTIEWSAAAQGFDYTLEIAADSAFTQIVHTATLQGTAHEIATPLDTSTTYYARVGSSNDCGTGSWSSTVSFTTEALPGDCPVGSIAQDLLAEDFAGGALPAGWSTAGSSGTVTWVASTAEAYNDSHSMFAQNIAGVTDQRLATPQVSLPGDALALFLNFQNWQSVESSGSGCFDGGLLEISTDGGASWAQVPQSEILVRDYDGTISTSYSNPLGGSSGWCGDPRDFWERYSVDLSSWAGQNVQFRFRFGTDTSVSRVGWHIDEVRVRSCTAGEPEYSIGGTVTGLEGSGLVLQNNSGDDLPITSDGPFVFATLMNGGSSYSVTVASNPTWPTQDCVVLYGSGTVGSSDVDNVEVSCETAPPDIFEDRFEAPPVP